MTDRVPHATPSHINHDSLGVALRGLHIDTSGLARVTFDFAQSDGGPSATTLHYRNRGLDDSPVAVTTKVAIR